MKNYKELIFSFGGGLLFFDEAKFYELTVSDEQIVLQEEIYNNGEKIVKTYKYSPNPNILSALDYFAFETKLPFPPGGFATDIAYPAILKISHDGKKKSAYFNIKNIKPILLRFIPKELVNRIYE